MNKNLEAKLFDKYPKIFRQKDLSMIETCMCWGIECDSGWYNLIDRLCYQIQWHIDHNLSDDDEASQIQVEAIQVKEKYGTLRFYYHGGNRFIDGLVSMAESLSAVTCERCGNPGEPNKKGWIKTLCEVCKNG